MARCTAPEILLKLVLTGTQTHYESRGLIDEPRLDHMLRAGKLILFKSHQESDVRQNLGFSPAVWQSLNDVLSKAIPVLELQSFSWKNPPANSYNNSSSDLIAANYVSLVKDIERLNDLCTIARNLLATTKKAQNLAAEKGFDQQILKLIDVCVRVTARGFDGESNVRNEERWQKVVNLYKRLLITCLQFLHNFIMHNEHRKLVLWLDLFGQSQPSQVEPPAIVEPATESMPKTKAAQEALIKEQQARIKELVDNLPKADQLAKGGGLGYNIDDVHALFDLMNGEKSPDVPTKEAAQLLMNKIRNDMERLSGLNANELDDNPEALLKVGAALRAQLPAKDFPLRGRLQEAATAAAAAAQATSKTVTTVEKASAAPVQKGRPMTWTDLPDLSQYPDFASTNLDISEDDMTMPRSSESAAETLQEAKDELMARLQDIPQAPNLVAPGDTAPGGSPEPKVDHEEDIIDSAEDSLDEEEEEDDDEDYRNPGDQERGLLTDVPLVLGPTEIEALPMIIQAGIVDSFGLKGGERHGQRNMQAVRCHILLAQEAGRNVLRELLIFIAAWDLPDDEFYFKMMVQIMEAILKNGLMSHAYSDFGQSKDIISPAQAVVIKILTHIFRAKYSPASVIANSSQPIPGIQRLPAKLTRVDVLTVRYIFTVFRGNIVPETCALIYLQGQIRAGYTLAEDFPLNLWDMERVYEGVYQFLEFFAVLTESSDWKNLLVEWEIVYDLVTLIKELDLSIPKAPLIQKRPPSAPAPSANDDSAASAATQDASTTSTPTPVAVERPFDTTSTTTSLTPPPTTAATLPAPLSPTPTSTSPPPPPSAEDPADFEWRNLKKLIVLVLSSLVWRSAVVQTQIRTHGGVDVVLSCTQYDGHNPYIKEHAVMCLKFLLEGNAENQRLVAELEGRQAVGLDGVPGGAAGLDGIGVDVDERGKVRLRASSAKPAATAAVAGASGAGASGSAGRRERHASSGGGGGGGLSKQQAARSSAPPPPLTSNVIDEADSDADAGAESEADSEADAETSSLDRLAPADNAPAALDRVNVERRLAELRMLDEPDTAEEMEATKE